MLLVELILGLTQRIEIMRISDNSTLSGTAPLPRMRIFGARFVSRNSANSAARASSSSTADASTIVNTSANPSNPETTVTTTNLGVSPIFQVLSQLIVGEGLVSSETMDTIGSSIRVNISNTNVVQNMNMNLSSFPEVTGNGGEPRTFAEFLAAVFGDAAILDRSTNAATPTSQEFIAQLKRKNFQELAGIDLAEAESCCICCEAFDKPPANNEENLFITLPNCHHRFHEKCILSWLELKNSCPMCRDVLPAY